MDTYMAQIMGPNLHGQRTASRMVSATGRVGLTPKALLYS